MCPAPLLLALFFDTFYLRFHYLLHSFGYRIENGKAVIDEAAAAQVRDLYKNYLSGLSLINTAKEAGLNLLHSGAKRMMLNRHYLGDDFYPVIIDPASFDAVSAELSKRSTYLGRNDRYIAPIIKRPPIRHSSNRTSQR